MRRVVQATDTMEEDDLRRLERAGYTPVVRWQRVTEDGHVIVLRAPEAVADILVRERRAARQRLRSVR